MVPGAVTLLAADPPREASIAFYDPSPGAVTAVGGAPSGEITVALPTAGGSSIRRRRVPARLVPVTEALAELSGLDPGLPGAAVWAAALRAGLALIARGRLYPAVTPGGHDAWRVGPLDPPDRRMLAELAAAFDPYAHAVCAEGAGTVRLASPEHLIRAGWDALADRLVRTAAAPLVLAPPPGARGEGSGRGGRGGRGAARGAARGATGSAQRGAPRARAGADTPIAFASQAPVHAETLRPWLAEASSGLDGAAGADVALRIELMPAGGFDGGDLDGGDLDGGDLDAVLDSAASGMRQAQPLKAPAALAVIQLTSRAESSLVVDAAELFSAPAAVLSRFGTDSESDLLRALRRIARAWPPAEQLLHEKAPSALDLDEDTLAELLAEGAERFAGTGVALLWPSEILATGIELRGVLTPTPGVVVEGGLNLTALVEFSWQATLDGEVLSETEIDQLAEAKRALVRLRGRFVAVDPALIERLRARRARRLQAAEALGLLLGGTIEEDGVELAVVAVGALADLAERLRALSGAEGRQLGTPPGLAGGVSLRPYQVRGVSWLAAMTSSGIGGCLADDMGLGKTLQLICLHLHRAAAGSGPTLVVCPTSLLANWEREVRRFAPDVPVRRYHGAGRTLAELDPGELVVTSYGIARRDTAELAEAKFSLVVADEAQHAKNAETATARALRAITAPVRLALTGTPVENRLAELWSILDWTTPGLLGPFERFVRTVATPIEKHHDATATERLARVIRPFVLRRRKIDPGVAPDLPARMVSDVPVPLTAEQVTLYEAEVREAMAAIEGQRGIARQALVLRLLTVLKQICNHPAQYLHQHGPLAGRSGKLAVLEELVEVIVSEGESVLVFSQFVECLALVEARLTDLGVPVLFLHGKVPVARRASLVASFQAGEAPVMLLSLKAGGVGLNLTRATHVVHFDRWWNPAVEEQATDRAHRIGQDRPVQVHRLVAEGTLEDRIAEMIERKRALAESVVGAGESWIGQLSNSDLRELVSLGSGA